MSVQFLKASTLRSCSNENPQGNGALYTGHSRKYPSHRRLSRLLARLCRHSLSAARESTVQIVQKIACQSCDVQVLDMNKPDVAAKAKQYGVKTVPAVVIDGQLASCCTRAGPNEQALRSAGLGLPK